MITAPFEYRRAGSVDEAISLLGELGEDAKLIAGGHSLVPLMKLRLAAPTHLIDIGSIGGMDSVDVSGDGVRIGALTRHVTLQGDDRLGIVQAVAQGIADQQVRNRGTIGGSIAHGDPASDLPTAMLALDAVFNAQGPGGERSIPAGEFFQDYLTTVLSPDEIITSIDIPSLDFGWGYEKFTRRAEDWAMVGVVALVGGGGARVALTNMGSTALRATAVEQALGGDINADSIASASEHAADGTEPPGDLNATPEYKTHLAKVLTKRALTTAAGV